jgi:ribosomal protein S12 methylthiotransferase
MTGFPGETEKDFELLLDFQQKAGLDWLGCFAYSREEDTPAWNMKGRVSKKTSEERKKIIEERQVPITEKQMDRFIGRVFDVLVEEQFDSGPDKTKLYLGRLPFQAPEVDGAAVISGDLPLEPGTMISCKIFARAGFDLEVRPC